MPTLCNLETVKHFVGDATVDTTHDGVLIGLLEAIEKEFIADVGWSIATASYTEYFAGNGKTEKTFDFGPVTAITSLSTQNSFADDTWTAIDTDNYKLRPSKGRYYVKYPSGFGSDVDYRLIYVAGYADTAIPEDIQRLIALWTVIEWSQLEPAGNKLLPHQISRAFSAAGVATTENFVKPEKWRKKIVDHYRIVPL